MSDMNVDRQLSAIESELELLQAISKRDISKIQKSKLYGKVDSVLFRKIDALHVEIPEDRDRRRACVKKAQAVIDSLQLKEDKLDNKESTCYPTFMGVALNISTELCPSGSVCLIDDEFQHILVKDGFVNRANARDSALSCVCSVIDQVQSSEQVLMDEGIIQSRYTRACISFHSTDNISSIYLKLRNVLRGESAAEQKQISEFQSQMNSKMRLKTLSRELRFTHTHVAIACYIRTFNIEVYGKVDKQTMRYGFISQIFSHIFISTYTLDLKDGALKCDHFTSHEIDVKLSPVLLAKSFLKSAFMVRNFENVVPFRFLDSLSTLYHIGIHTPFSEALVAEMQANFPHIEWESHSFANVSQVANAESHGCCILAKSIPLCNEPAILIFGLRSAERNDDVDCVNFMPFIMSYDTLPIEVTLTLCPSESIRHDKDKYSVGEFEIMTQDCLGSMKVVSIWKHFSRFPRPLDKDDTVEVKLKLDETRELFISTKVCDCEWEPDSRVFHNSSDKQYSGPAMEDSSVICRGWHCPNVAERFRLSGNDAFRQMDLPSSDTSDIYQLNSIDLYSIAISYSPTDYMLYSNRAAAAQKLGNYRLALSDAQICIRLAPAWPKGFIRAGDACICLSLYHDSVDFYKAALNLEQSNDINAKMLVAIEQREKHSKQAQKSSEDIRKAKKSAKKSSSCSVQ